MKEKVLKETLPINHRKFLVTAASCRRSKCIRGKVILVQGSLASDLELILGSLKLHNLLLQQLGEVSQAVIFTGSKCPWKLLFLGLVSHKHIQLWKHIDAGPRLWRLVT